MSDHHAVLIAGDISLDELQRILSPILDGQPREYDYGRAFDIGQRNLIDSDIVGDRYDDDLGLPLSRYRFEVSTSSRLDGHEWAGQAFDLLSRETTLDLLWLTNTQRIEGERTLTAA